VSKDHKIAETILDSSPYTSSSNLNSSGTEEIDVD